MSRGRKTHILGFSMGGLVAQEFALKYPGRVAGLVLVSTHPGGERALQIPENIANAILSD
ncbi:MAG: alpha/beta fold hydrolase [Candidatus Jordarchaeales archaeon]